MNNTTKQVYKLSNASHLTAKGKLAIEILNECEYCVKCGQLFPKFNETHCGECRQKQAPKDAC
jgi:hypothetical protein